jgi:hypothetical protein
LEKKAAGRERGLFLTAKLDRTWSALTRLRAKVGAARFRDLVVDLPDALGVILGWGGIAEFQALVGGDGLRAFLAEVSDAIESGRDPGAFWAKWIDAVVERTPPPEAEGPIDH